MWTILAEWRVSETLRAPGRQYEGSRGVIQRERHIQDSNDLRVNGHDYREHGQRKAIGIAYKGLQ